MFDGIFTNILADGEVPGYVPDADGDWFLLGDYTQDHNYWHTKVCDAIKSLGTSGVDCRIIRGGVISDSGSGQIDISEAIVLTKDASGNARFMRTPALTNITLPTGWKDNRQIWVIAQYDYKLSTATRNHFEGTNYHHQLEDTYYGDPVGLVGGSTDNLFVDSDPNAVPDTICCLGSFQMSAGDVFTDLSTGERSTNAVGTNSGVDSDTVDGTHAYSFDSFDYTIYDQTTFNAAFTRTGADDYRINDSITSLKFFPGTYLAAGILSGGDTDPFIDVNNCLRIEGNKAVIDFVGNEGGLEITSDYTKINDLIVTGDGTALSSTTGSFVITAYSAQIINCIASDRDCDGFYSTTTYGKNMQINHCVADAMVNGFYQVYGILDCYAFSNTAAGFYACTAMTRCVSETNGTQGYNLCTRITNSVAFSNIGAGFLSCAVVASSYSTGNTYGFQTCLYLGTDCYGTGNTVVNFTTSNGNCASNAVAPFGTESNTGQPLFYEVLLGTILDTNSTVLLPHGVPNMFTNSRMRLHMQYLNNGVNSLIGLSDPTANVFPRFAGINNTDFAFSRGGSVGSYVVYAAIVYI